MSFTPYPFTSIGISMHRRGQRGLEEFNSFPLIFELSVQAASMLIIVIKSYILPVSHRTAKFLENFM